MSGVLRLSNNVTGRSTIIASASNDQTFTLPAIGGTLLAGGSSLEVIFPPGTEALPGLHVQGDIDTGLYAPAANTLAISTDGSERLRVDSSGRVGIGTTSPNNQLSIGSTASFETDANSFYLGSNFTGTGQNFIGSSKHAQRLFFNNASSNGYLSYANTGSAGTAGNAITWQERFRIDSSGNVGIGTSAPSSPLTVDQVNGNVNLELHSSSSGRGAQIKTHNDHATFFHGLSGDTIGDYIYYTADAKNHVFSTSNVERLRIDSSGNVGVGVSSLNSSSRLTLLESTGNGQTLEIKGANAGGVGSQPGIKFTASTGDNIGGIFGDTNSDAVVLQSGGTERMQITSAGNLLVGTSSERDKFFGSLSLPVQVEGSTTDKCSLAITRNGNTGDSAKLVLAHARGTAYQILQNNDAIGDISWQAADGAKFGQAANIRAFVDGTPSLNNTPGYIAFGTTSYGANNPTERMRILSTGGITFNGDTAQENALNDYEQGTWSPTYTGGVSSVTYGNRYGYYVKIGRQVTVWCNVMTNAVTISNSSAILYIGGLPFVSTNASESSSAVNMGQSARWLSSPPHSGLISPNSTSVKFYDGTYATTATDPTLLTAGNMHTGSGNKNIMRWTATYQT